MVAQPKGLAVEGARYVEDNVSKHEAPVVGADEHLAPVNPLTVEIRGVAFHVCHGCLLSYTKLL